MILFYVASSGNPGEYIVAQYYLQALECYFGMHHTSCEDTVQWRSCDLSVQGTF